MTLSVADLSMLAYSPKGLDRDEKWIGFVVARTAESHHTGERWTPTPIEERVMAKCPACHQDNLPGTPFCSKCGEQLEPRGGGAPADGKPDVSAAQPGGGAEPTRLEGEILALMRGGHKIEAIKLHRARTGSDLKGAKDVVEALAAQHGISPKGAGCAGALLLMLAGLGMAVKWMWG
jgi:hypothetical protein